MPPGSRITPGGYDGCMSNRELPLVDIAEPASTGGCGCGGCGCGAGGGEGTADVSAIDPAAAVTGTYGVSGLTCGHCAKAVREELSALEGVSAVEVELVANGVSTVTVTSIAPIQESAITGALAEAGDYALV